MFNRSLAIVMVVVMALASQRASCSDKLDNEAVLKLLSSGLPESTVVMAIQNSQAEFDTSPDAIIELNKKGVPQTVLEAMIAKAGEAGAQPAASKRFDPEQILLEHDGKVHVLRYLRPTFRTAARAMGFGGVAQYAVLNGASAQLAVDSGDVSFTVAVPKNAQPQAYMTLVRLEPRRNGTREIATGGGYMSYSTGFVKERIVATVANPLDDQAGAPDGFVIFSMRPADPLAAGEYAIVTANSKIQVPGFFSGMTDSFFDFSVRH
ncbi:MAG: hypothetical protein KatS3mg126_0622 [Lysobacteraceae bacterium]|nr:MAG: hypothetical protein KatS3mg126_0622 [Xanthomonadaceae bacterium]